MHPLNNTSTIMCIMSVHMKRIVVYIHCDICVMPVHIANNARRQSRVSNS